VIWHYDLICDLLITGGGSSLTKYTGPVPATMRVRRCTSSPPVESMGESRNFPKGSKLGDLETEVSKWGPVAIEVWGREAEAKGYIIYCTHVNALV